jgi:hypothetical protein
MFTGAATLGKVGARSAFSLGVLTVVAMLTGVLLISALGGSSGRDLGATASGTAIMEVAPLLAAAELLKLATGACLATLVLASAPAQSKLRAGAYLSGCAGAGLIAASGFVGLYALASQSREMGTWASALGFASSGATAIWVLTFLGGSTVALSKWHRTVGCAFAGASLLSLIVAPLALPAGLFGFVWWFGLSRAPGSSRTQL